MDGLTEGERRVLTLAMQCYETQPKVDYARLMELGRYKTKASATAVYLAARKKMMAAGAALVAGNDDTADGRGGNATPASGCKRKAAGSNKMAIRDDNEVGPSKRRGKKAHCETMAVAKAETDEDHFGTPVKAENDDGDEAEVEAGDGNEDGEEV